MSSEGLPATIEKRPGRLRRLWQAARLQLVLCLATLAVIELILQLFQPAYLKDKFWNSLHYHNDPELGWFPAPNSNMSDDTANFMRVRHNSLGLRDVEYERSPKPTILFVGDSLVWGYLVDEEVRFTNLLAAQLPGHTVVNAGISGYGTDQEYLLLKRIWNHVKPDVVVLVVCVDNDRADNTRNVRYNNFKPYFEMTADGEGQFRGQPVPKSRPLYFTQNWLFEHVWLARLAAAAYVELRHPRVTVPDPTEKLVGMMRDLIEERGANFLVGLQHQEAPLEAFLQRENIPYTTFDGARLLSDNVHWAAEGHILVAERTMQLLSDAGMLREGLRPFPSMARP